MNNDSWRGKVNRARYVERQIVRWVRKKFDPEAILTEGYCEEWDIISPKLGNVEIKEDRIAHYSNNYAIEYQKGNDKPGGITATKAKFFVIVDWNYVLICATDALRYIVDNTPDKKSVDMGDKFDSGRKSKGWLIPREILLHSPFVTVYKRWFPVLQENEVRTN